MNEAHRAIARLREKLILAQEMMLALAQKRGQTELADDIAMSLANHSLDRARHIERLESIGEDYLLVDAEMACIRAEVRAAAAKL